MLFASQSIPNYKPSDTVKQCSCLARIEYHPIYVSTWILDTQPSKAKRSSVVSISCCYTRIECQPLIYVSSWIFRTKLEKRSGYLLQLFCSALARLRSHRKEWQLRHLNVGFCPTQDAIQQLGFTVGRSTAVALSERYKRGLEARTTSSISKSRGFSMAEYVHLRLCSGTHFPRYENPNLPRSSYSPGQDIASGTIGI